MTHVAAIVNQTDFRGRVDSGNEATPTWIANANTNWTQDIDADFRVRFVLAETAGASSAETISPELWFNINGGSFALVTASTAVQFGAFTGSTDGDASTQQLGAGSFVTGSLDDNGSMSDVDIQNNETEFEWCLTIDSGQVDDADVIILRIRDAGSEVDVYGNEPTITVNEAAGAQTITGASYVDPDAFGAGTITTPSGSAVVQVGTSDLAISETLDANVFTAASTHTAAGGANNCIVVLITTTSASSNFFNLENTVVKYGPATMVLAAAWGGTGINETATGVWYLMDPSTSAQTLEFTIELGYTARAGAATILEYENVDAASPVGATSVGAVGDETVSITATGTDNAIVVVTAVRGGTDGPFTPTADTTELEDYSTGGTAYSDHVGFVGKKEGTVNTTAYTMGGDPVGPHDTDTVTAVEFNAGAGAGTQTITGVSYVDTDAFGSGSISTGAVTITGASYIDADAFGSGSIGTTYDITGVSHVNVNAFGAGTVVAGPVSITGASYVDPDSFGAGTVTAGVVAIVGASYVDADAFGTGNISTTYNIAGAAYVNGSTFGVGAISTGAVTITGASYDDPDAFGSGSIVQAGGTQTITGVSFVDGDAFGSGAIGTSYTISGASYVDADAFGAGAISAAYEITGLSFADPDTFGVGAISTSYDITGASYADPDAFGSGAIVQAGGAQTIVGVAYVDSDSFGTGSIDVGPVTITGVSYIDTDAFGAGVVSTTVTITGASYTDADTFGSGTVSSVVNIDGSPYVDPDSFGAGAIIAGVVTITGLAYVDPDAFGVGAIVQGAQSTGRTVTAANSANKSGGVVTLNVSTLGASQTTTSLTSSNNTSNIVSSRNRTVNNG